MPCRGLQRVVDYMFRCLGFQWLCWKSKLDLIGLDLYTERNWRRETGVGVCGREQNIGNLNLIPRVLA